MRVAVVVVVVVVVVVAVVVRYLHCLDIELNFCR